MVAISTLTCISVLFDCILFSVIFNHILAKCHIMMMNRKSEKKRNQTVQVCGFFFCCCFRIEPSDQDEIMSCHTIWFVTNHIVSTFAKATLLMRLIKFHPKNINNANTTFIARSHITLLFDNSVCRATYQAVSMTLMVFHNFRLSNLMECSFIELILCILMMIQSILKLLLLFYIVFTKHFETNAKRKQRKSEQVSAQRVGCGRDRMATRVSEKVFQITWLYLMQSAH